MYNHVVNRINTSANKYKTFVSNNAFSDSNQFDGILLYSQIHIALSNKIFMKLSDTLTQSLKNYWRNLKPKIKDIQPREEKLKIQCNLQMPWLKGIADAYAIDDDEKTTSIYEIKASSNPD